MISATEACLPPTQIPISSSGRHTAGQLRQPLLQLLAVVVRGGLLDLHAELRAPTLDVSLLAGAVDDRGVPRTNKLYDRTGDEITLDEIERITS